VATIRRFEDIEGWQKARELVRAVYAVSGRGDFAKDFGLRDQIRRSAVSVMANIAEGFERDGTAEFLQYLSVAKASAAEVESHLYVAPDQGYVTRDEFDGVRDIFTSTRPLIAGLVRYLKESDIRGLKHRPPS
jgi:four helix bundle protein